MQYLVALVFGLTPLPLTAEPAARVQLDPVSYSDLAGELRALKGKVVLVDVWGTFCAPCREKFPEVVAWHSKYAREGLAVVSVSVDPPDDRAARAAALEFLTAQRASFRNVLLRDEPAVWQEKWKIDGPPLVFLFDRGGRLVRRWEGKLDSAAIEKTLTAVLKE